MKSSTSKLSLVDASFLRSPLAWSSAAPPAQPPEEGPSGAPTPHPTPLDQRNGAEDLWAGVHARDTAAQLERKASLAGQGHQPRGVQHLIAAAEIESLTARKRNERVEALAMLAHQGLDAHWKAFFRDQVKRTRDVASANDAAAKRWVARQRGEADRLFALWRSREWKHGKPAAAAAAAVATTGPDHVNDAAGHVPRGTENEVATNATMAVLPVGKVEVGAALDAGATHASNVAHCAEGSVSKGSKNSLRTNLNSAEISNGVAVVNERLSDGAVGAVSSESVEGERINDVKGGKGGMHESDALLAEEIATAVAGGSVDGGGSVLPASGEVSPNLPSFATLATASSVIRDAEDDSPQSKRINGGNGGNGISPNKEDIAEDNESTFLLCITDGEDRLNVDEEQSPQLVASAIDRCKAKRKPLDIDMMELAIQPTVCEVALFDPMLYSRCEGLR